MTKAVLGSFCTIKNKKARIGARVVAPTPTLSTCDLCSHVFMLLTF